MIFLKIIFLDYRALQFSTSWFSCGTIWALWKRDESAMKARWKRDESSMKARWKHDESTMKARRTDDKTILSSIRWHDPGDHPNVWLAAGCTICQHSASRQWCLSDPNFKFFHLIHNTLMVPSRQRKYKTSVETICDELTIRQGYKGYLKVTA